MRGPRCGRGLWSAATAVAALGVRGLWSGDKSPLFYLPRKAATGVAALQSPRPCPVLSLLSALGGITTLSFVHGGEAARRRFG